MRVIRKKRTTTALIPSFEGFLKGSMTLKKDSFHEKRGGGGSAKTGVEIAQGHS